jgi:hypothetical protein
LCIVHPHSYKDVEERVKKTFPKPIDQWCIEEGQQAVGKGKKKNPLVLPVDKIHPLLQKVILWIAQMISLTLQVACRLMPNYFIHQGEY